MLTRPHVLWVDNYSKVFRKSVPTTNKGRYNTCLWTGYAAFVCDTPNIQTTLLKNRDGMVIPGMPDNLCSEESVDQVKAGITFVSNNIRKYYYESVVLQYDVANVPPKINTNIHTRLRTVVEHVKNSTKNVHPLKLLKRDIGSNAGLISVLVDICETYGVVDQSCTDYVILNVDSNIYWRILKVLLCICSCLCMLCYV